MRRLLVFQHVAHEILGILDPILREAGFRIRYVNFERQPDAKPTLDRYHGLIVLGGPMNCDQTDRYPHLATEVALINEAIRMGLPVLGICLGSQLIARALGATVRKNPVKEIGWYTLNPTSDGAQDPLFSRLDATQQIFQWHGDTFDLPANAVRLASSPDCANQAFRYGENVYGLQFHLEVDEPMIRRWLHKPSNASEFAGYADPQARIAEIETETQRFIEHSESLGRQLFGAYLKLFQHRPRRTALPSR